MSLAIVFQGMQNCVHHFEDPTLLEVVLRPMSHILDLSLLLANCSKVAENYFKLSLIAEGTELLHSLSFVGLFLESNSPCSKGSAEDVNALLLQNSHHLSLKVSFRLLSVVVIDQRLEGT